MTEYAAVVYDLDGTLVRLAVDWDAAARDARAALRDAGIDIGSDAGAWESLDRAHEHGHGEAVSEAIASHERRGAATSERLSAADDVASASGPVGVVSLNSEAAVRIALETHELDDLVDAVVGRDTVGAYKPDPEPLLWAARALSVGPEETLFVGDSKRDEETARRAGTAFEYVGDGPRYY